jgi:hypothetical protein
MDALGEAGAFDQAAGMFGAFLGMHLPADDLAAEKVLDQVQAVELSPDRGPLGRARDRASIHGDRLRRLTDESILRKYSRKLFGSGG